MKRILLPTDFSDNAYNAIRYALQCFKKQECTFYLLNTYTPITYSVEYLIETPVYYDLEDVARMKSEKELHRVEEKIKQEFANPKHSFIKISVFNMLVNEIKQLVEENDIDLVVMGTKGATGAKEIFLGTHTMYTIKKIACPVIAVPGGFEYEVPKEILFPTDFHFNTSNKFLPLIKDICNTHVARLHVLNAYYGVPLNDHQEEVKEYLDVYFGNNAHLFHIADGMDVIEAIDDFKRNNIINLLVMVHNKHSFFDNLLFKPVVNNIAYHTNIPFLVIPSEKRMKSSKKRKDEKNTLAH